jgi:hypothetical protein
VAEAYRDNDADLVVLSWSQDASVGHAKVVRDVLTASTIPVLLLPVAAGHPGRPEQDGSERRRGRRGIHERATRRGA